MIFKKEIKKKLLKEYKVGDGITVIDYLLEKAIEETSKAKDEEFLELLNKEQKDRSNPNIIRAFCIKLKEKKNGKIK